MIVNDALAEIATNYGLRNQLLKLAEECSELARASIRLAQATTDEDVKSAYNNLVEEMADVEILTEQIKMLLSTEAEIEEDIAKQILYKVQRTYNRMRKEVQEK